MARARRHHPWVLAVLLSLCGAATVSAASDVKVTTPKGPGDPSARVLAEIALPDVRATLRHVEATAATVAPGTLPPGALPAMVGQRFNDPDLTSLGSGPVVALVLAPEGPNGKPGGVLFIPVKDPKAYQDFTAGAGLASSTARGLVIVASDARALTAGRALETRYRSIAAAAPAGQVDLRFRLNAPLLMELYGPLLRLGAGTMLEKMKEAPAAAGPGKAPPAFLSAILRAELMGGLALMEQIDEVQVDVALLPEAVASETVLVARPGSTLFELAQAPPPGSNRAAALLDGGASMAAAYRFDAARVTAFALGILKEMESDPEVAKVLTPEVVELFREAGAVYTGEGAVRMDFRPGEAEVPQMVMQAVAGVTDEGRALALVERSFALMTPMMEGLAGSPLPVQFTLQKNARTSGGVPVHRVRIANGTASAKATPRVTAKATPKARGKTAVLEKAPASPLPMNLDMEFAFTHGYYLAAQDAAGLDRLIARAGGAAGPASTLRSEKAFGPGRHFYLDYDFVSLLKSVPSPAGQPNPFAVLKDVEADPILYTIGMDRGKLRFEQRVPLKPFAAIVQAGRGAAAEKAEKAGKP